MKAINETLFAIVFENVVYDDGDNGDAGNSGEGGAGGAGGTGGDSKATDDLGIGVELSPEQAEAVKRKINQINKEKEEKALKIMRDLKSLQARTDLTTNQREELENRLSSVQKELLTKEQLFEEERKKKEEEAKNAITDLEKERDSWREKFTTSQINRALVDAAARHNAFNPQNVVDILYSRTALEDKLDDEGNPTGEFAPKVKMNMPDKDGKVKELVLTVPEAVKRMTESDEYMHLFKGKGTGGLGGGNKSGEKLTAAEAAKLGPKAYREWRKQNGL